MNMNHPLSTPGKDQEQQSQSLHYSFGLHTPASSITPTDEAPSSPPLHQYESLTGLLNESGTPTSYGVDLDDESYNHLSMEDGFLNMSQDGISSNARRDSGRCRICGYSFRYDSPCAILLGIIGISSLGVMLGLIFPSTPTTTTTQQQQDDPSASNSTETVRWDTISNILGYTYFLAWTLSFYPQIITNYKYPHKVHGGVSLDFIVWNIVGFACHAFYTTSFCYSSVVRKEYVDRFGGGDDAIVDGNATDSMEYNNLGVNVDEVFPNPFNNWTWGNGNSTTDDGFDNDDGGSSSNATNSNDHAPIAVPQVKGNDVAFAWHALLLTIITFIQITWWSERHNNGKQQQQHVYYSTQNERNSQSSWVESSTSEKDGNANVIHSRSLENDVALTGSPLGGEEQETTTYNSPLEQRVNNDDDTNHQQEHYLHNEQEPNNLQSMPTQSMAAPSAPGHNIHWTHRISSTTKFLILLLLLMCIAGAIMVACDVNFSYWGGGDQWQWIDYLYFLSFVKVGVSIVKYIPQVRKWACMKSILCMQIPSDACPSE